ncbi:MAG: acetyl-CoA carboxylase biotin carboxyl carrier protein, partial [Glaciecola sp.]
MDLKDIQELIKFVAKSGATEVDLEIDNIKISIKSPEKKRRGEIDEITTIIQQPTSSVMAAPAVTATAIASTPEVDENANYITIKSSMIGTFYRSSSP